MCCFEDQEGRKPGRKENTDEIDPTEFHGGKALLGGWGRSEATPPDHVTLNHSNETNKEMPRAKPRRRQEEKMEH